MSGSSSRAGGEGVRLGEGADLAHLRRFKKVTLITAAAFMAVVGLALGIRYLLFMAGLLALLPTFSSLLATASLYGLSSRRLLPKEAEEGEEVPVTLVVRNDSLFPRFLLHITDRLPAGTEVSGGETESSTSGLWPGEEMALRYRARLLGRGRVAFPDPELRAFDLLGLSSRSRRLPTPAQLMLLPKPAPVPRWLPLGSGPYAGAVAAKGDGPDFHGVREYRPGDDLRRIHWKLTARRGELVIRELEEERGGDVALALLLPPEAPLDLRERAVRVAVGVARMAFERGCNLILVRPRAKPRRFSPREWGALRRFIAEFQPEPVDLQGLLKVASMLPGGGPLLIVAPLPCPQLSRLPPERAAIVAVAERRMSPEERPPGTVAVAVPSGPEPFSVAWE